jgi:hypothetical protein
MPDRRLRNRSLTVAHRDTIEAAPATNTAKTIKVAVAGLILQRRSSEPTHISHAGTIHPVARANPIPASGQARRRGKRRPQEARPRPAKTTLQIARSITCRVNDGTGANSGASFKKFRSSSAYPIFSR